ncbi:flavodoxin domain-containing protein [Salisediminibacterium beveridgei]|uniref:Flavodoxin n=1 Tax=Salisediminibacterium beveridgei TaxID=632773 RepID=A0A1D7QZC1_9BACI|nr:flavodoxin domain-containing protein [Salisediminibacterium beveridgei]AOM84359.1 Flavodoxin [Salisediminibacterium beveridgei]
MALTNYNPKIVILPYSMTGNTRAVADLIRDLSGDYAAEIHPNPDPKTVPDLIRSTDILMIGTYSWGNGEIPEGFSPILDAVKSHAEPGLITGVFGTGDSFYPAFCGAVDRLAEDLHDTCFVAERLKIELMPQPSDIDRCRTFIHTLTSHLAIATPTQGGIRS